MRNDFKNELWPPLMKKVILMLFIVIVATSLRAIAEPSDCLKPTETNSWELVNTSSPDLDSGECISDERLFTVEGHHPPYSLWEKLGNSVPYEWSFIKEVESKFIYSTCEGPTGDCTSIKITDATGNESNTIVLGDVDGLVYSSDNPEEADPGSSVIISVEGGMPPYTWTAGGDGFSFEEEVTTGTSNILYLTEDACGAGDVTVECPCDQAVGGSIRSTNGEWESYFYCSGIANFGGKNCYSQRYMGGCHETIEISPTEYWDIDRSRWLLFHVEVEGSYCAVNSTPCEDLGECSPPNEYEGSSSLVDDIVFTRAIRKYRWVCQ